MLKPRRPPDSNTPVRLSTKLISMTPTKLNIAIVTTLRNLSVTWMLKNLYAASVPPKATMVARTAWKTIVASPTNDAMTLENAPTNTPSTTAYAMTRAGLTTFLKELTSDSTKPMIAPPMARRYAMPWAACAAVGLGSARSPMKNQVTRRRR